MKSSHKNNHKKEKEQTTPKEEKEHYQKTNKAQTYNKDIKHEERIEKT